MRKLIGAVFDDNRANGNVIMKHGEKVEWVEIVGNFTEPMEGMEYVRKHHLDFIILDVEMGSINGLELMQALPKEIHVVLYTGYNQYEDAGYERKAIDVLKKPTTLTRFTVAMERVRKELGIENDSNELFEGDNFYFNIKGDTRYKRTMIRFKEIIFIENKDGRLYFHLVGEEIPKICNEPFTRIRGILPDKWFMQIHQSFIINTDFYRSYSKGMAELTVNNIRLKTGRKENYPDFFHWINTKLL